MHRTNQGGVEMETKITLKVSLPQAALADFRAEVEAAYNKALSEGAEMMDQKLLARAFYARAGSVEVHTKDRTFKLEQSAPLVPAPAAAVPAATVPAEPVPVVEPVEEPARKKPARG